jgi:very-short-patch-repair endonuclease
MTKDLARKLRRNATPSEQGFWRLTWPLRQAGWPFRRQHLIGSYYVDFACLKAGLVVEIDGDTHSSETAQSNDAARDDYLRGRGFTVIRFSNRDVTSNPDGVFAVLSAYLDTLPFSPPPHPSPQRGGSHIASDGQIEDEK